MSVQQLEKILDLDVKSAHGCTEPVTIALAASKAAAQITTNIVRVKVKLSANLLKNAMEVGIPGTNGAVGIPLAAALGCFCRDKQPNLQLFKSIDNQWLCQANQMVAEELIEVELAEKRYGLYADCSVYDDSGNIGRAVVEGNHENLVLVEKNNEIVYESKSSLSGGTDQIAENRKLLAEASFGEIWNNISELSNQARKRLLEGVEINVKIAQKGLTGAGKLKIGNVYEQLINKGWLGDDVLHKAKALTAAAVDARMSGCNLSVMTSAGSGNQGLTITLPLKVLAEKIRASEEKLTEALALSHGITSILKHHSGTLSAMCGCVVCAGTGLTVGVTYLLSGSLEDATAAVNNMVGSITGIICDGAKVGCSIKLLCAVDSAFQSAMIAVKGIKLPVSNGVLGQTIESSLANIGLIAAPGMIETDEQILRIMLRKPVVSS